MTCWAGAKQCLEARFCQVFGVSVGCTISILQPRACLNCVRQVEALDLNPGTAKFDVDTRKEFRAFKLSQQRT